jgi:hypothetical protein
VAVSDVPPGKRSVSVSRATFDNDVAMTWIVDEAVAPVLAGAQPAAFPVETVSVVTVPAAARRPARSRPAPPPEHPIPFWLLPTGPIRK